MDNKIDLSQSKSMKSLLLKVINFVEQLCKQPWIGEDNYFLMTLFIPYILIF